MSRLAGSVLGLLKIGLGLSSSHTVTPICAARLFVQRLAQNSLLAQLARLKCSLDGSLVATGKGHPRDRVAFCRAVRQRTESASI